MKARHTYEEISRQTGVSIATISRIFNGSSGVSNRMRTRVLDKLEEMGYERSEFLYEKKNKKIVIFNVPSFENPFYEMIIKGAVESARRNGIDIVFYEDPLEDDSVDDFLSLLKSIGASGVITTSTLTRDNLLRIYSQVPLVQCCECLEKEGVPFVTIDDRTSAKNAIRHLVSVGKKKIAFINGPMKFKYARERLQGYKDALDEEGMEFDSSYVITLPSVNYDMALSSASLLLNSQSKPDGFFAASDVFAAAVLKAASRLGLSVPEDIAVVGFDNISLSYMSNPAITTINQPKYQIGLLSADMIARLINSEPMSVKEIWLDTELIIRESTLR